MRRRLVLTAIVFAGFAVTGLGGATAQEPVGFGPNPVLPKPDLAHGAVNFSKVIGWPADGRPQAPEGFTVTRFAGDLQSPRWLHVLPNGDVLAVESESGRIRLLRGTDDDGVADQQVTLLSGLNMPFGMAYANGALFVADTDAVLRYAYTLGDTTVAGKPQTILKLPAGGYNNHWTRNLLLSRDGTKLYVTVGSGSNVGEHGPENEVGRAAIHEIALDGAGDRIVASGLRNPVGLAFEPSAGTLWAAVNERDMIGDDLVPDYITGVKDGAFYGWPYSYWGKNPDPRQAGKGTALVEKAIAPDYAVGAHTASLGLAFYTGTSFPESYRGGAFVAQHGSWNRRPFSGYKVIFIPFRDGKPSGAPQDFLTGFLKPDASGKAFGRPVGVFEDGKGALLVTDDVGGTIWRIARR